MSKTKGLPIPITAAEFLAGEYGYDQVIILAFTPGTQWRTTYGVNEEQCKQAAEGASRIMKLLEIDNGKRFIDQIVGGSDAET